MPGSWHERIRRTWAAACSSTGDCHGDGLLRRGGNLWTILQRTLASRSRCGLADCRRDLAGSRQSGDRSSVDTPSFVAIARGAYGARDLFDSNGVRYLLSTCTNARFGWYNGASLSAGSHWRCDKHRLSRGITVYVRLAGNGMCRRWRRRNDYSVTENPETERLTTIAAILADALEVDLAAFERTWRCATQCC